MLEGIGFLATIFRQGQRLLDQVLEWTDPSTWSCLRYSRISLVNVAGMTQHQVGLFSPIGLGSDVFDPLCVSFDLLYE